VRARAGCAQIRLETPVAVRLSALVSHFLLEYRRTTSQSSLPCIPSRRFLRSIQAATNDRILR